MATGGGSLWSKGLDLVGSTFGEEGAAKLYEMLPDTLKQYAPEIVARILGSWHRLQGARRSQQGGQPAADRSHRQPHVDVMDREGVELSAGQRTKDDDLRKLEQQPAARQPSAPVAAVHPGGGAAPGRVRPRHRAPRSADDEGRAGPHGRRVRSALSQFNHPVRPDAPERSARLDHRLPRRQSAYRSGDRTDDERASRQCGAQQWRAERRGLSKHPHPHQRQDPQREHRSRRARRADRDAGCAR